MNQQKLLDAHIQAKRMYHHLGEVLDLTRQLAQATDRNDSVSIHMILNMREEPLRALAEARDALRQQFEDAGPEEDSLRLRALFNGAPAENETEQGLVQQIAANTRLLQQIRQLDEPLNRKLTREKTIYD